MNFGSSGVGLGEEKFNVTANVEIGNLKLERKLTTAVELISTSLDRLTRLFERLEKPISAFIYASGASLLLFATFHIIHSLRSMERQ